MIDTLSVIGEAMAAIFCNSLQLCQISPWGRMLIVYYSPNMNKFGCQLFLEFGINLFGEPAVFMCLSQLFLM